MSPGNKGTREFNYHLCAMGQHTGPSRSRIRLNGGSPDSQRNPVTSLKWILPSVWVSGMYWQSSFWVNSERPALRCVISSRVWALPQFKEPAANTTGGMPEDEGSQRGGKNHSQENDWKWDQSRWRWCSKVLYCIKNYRHIPKTKTKKNPNVTLESKVYQWDCSHQTP